MKRIAYILLLFSISSFGKTLHVDPVDGDNANNGLSTSAPVETMVYAQSLLDNTFDSLILSDTTHYGVMNITSIIYSYGDSLIITTWDKFGTGRNAKVKGLTEVTSWNEYGDYWTKTSLTGLPDLINILDLGYTVWAATCMNGMFVNDTFCDVSKYPNTKTYYDIETGNGTNTIRDSDEGIASSGYWDDGILVSQNASWINSKFPISSYASDGTYTLLGYNWGDQDLSDYDGMKYFIMNHHNATDQEYEWNQSFDGDSVEIYYTGNLNSQDVYLPLQDSCISVYNSDYITIRKLDFYGANKAQIKIENSLGVNIDSCKFYYSPMAAIAEFDSDTTRYTNNYIYYASDNGILSFGGDYTYIFNNKLLGGVGTRGTFGGSRDGKHLNGIIIGSFYGDVFIKRNKMDSVGHCAIHIKDANALDADVYITENYMNAASNVVTDNAAIYTFWCPYNSTKIIRNNIITNTIGNIAFNRNDAVETRAIYMDEGWPGASNDINRGWLIDSNLVTGSCRGFFQNTDTRQIEWRNNTVANTIDYDTYDGYNYHFAHYSSYTDSTHVKHNDFIAGTTTNSDWYLMYLNDWNGFTSPTDERNNRIDSNRYFNPFDLTGDIWLTNDGSPGWAYNTRTLSFIQTNTIWEDESTFNETGHDYADVSSITEDQFVWCFYNWSSTEHEYDLASTVFEDLDGNSVSGTMTIQPYKHKVLFYVSGGVVGLPNPIYEGTDEETETTTTTTRKYKIDFGTTGNKYLIKMGDTKYNIELPE